MTAHQPQRDPAGDEPGEAVADLIARLEDDQRARWQEGERLLVEAYLERYPQLHTAPEQVVDLIYQEFLLRRQAGEEPMPEEYLKRFPQLEESLRVQFEVHAMLGAASAPVSPTLSSHANPKPGHPAGTGPLPEIPGYEILGELGRGGMGVVYLAWQGSLRRLVALKMLLNGGLAEPAALARFRVEAEAAARLQHPQIVQVHEYGEHHSRPYLALEYIDGEGLDKKLQGAPQPAAQAARLIETLARAVHAAHRQGVVHRDLKPANVLLAADGTPKITDFGLAKLMVGGGLVLTQTGDFVGTPSYMAPEQAEGRTREVGPVTDVYALGAILYELLTGRPPFRAASPLETARQVVADEPVPPSRLQPRLPRDLTTICLKCLQKEPKKRYASAELLADDLGRFLRGESIRARPAASWERTWRWCRRNPRVAGLAVALAVVLVGSLVTVTGLWLRADEQRRQADKLRFRAEELQRQAESEAHKAGSLREVLIGKYDDPVGITGRSFVIPRRIGERLTVQSILQRGTAMTLKRLQDQGEIRATVLDTIGEAYRALGMYAEAEPLLQSALDLRHKRLGDNDLAVAASLHNLAMLYHDQCAFARARPLYEQALAIRRQQRVPDARLVSESLFSLAWLLTEMEDFAKGADLFRELRGQPLGDEDRQVILARADLGLAGLEADQENYQEAMRRALPAIQTLLERDGDARGDARLIEVFNIFKKTVLVDILVLRRYRAAKESLEECLILCRRALLPGHFYETFVLYVLAHTLEQLGDDGEAEKRYRECLDVVEERIGLENPRSVIVISALTRLLQRRHKRPEADRLLQRFVDAQRQRFGEDHFLTANALMAYASLLAEWADNAPHQEELAQEALTIYQKTGGPACKLYTTCLRTLANAWLRQGKARDAELLLRDALPLVRQRPGAKRARIAAVQTELALALLAQAKQVEAEGLLRDCLAIDPKATDQLLAAGGPMYRAAGHADWAAAVALARQQLWPTDPQRLVQAARELALCIPASDPARADQWAGEAVRILRKAIAQGFPLKNQLQTDAAFAPLRKHPDYPKLMDAAEPKEKPMGLEEAAVPPGR